MRISTLRARGVKPIEIIAMRRANRANRAVSAPVAVTVDPTIADVLAQVRAAVDAVKTPNGTTRKIARILDGAPA